MRLGASSQRNWVWRQPSLLRRRVPAILQHRESETGNGQVGENPKRNARAGLAPAWGSTSIPTNSTKTGQMTMVTISSNRFPKVNRIVSGALQVARINSARKAGKVRNRESPGTVVPLGNAGDEVEGLMTNGHPTKALKLNRRSVPTPIEPTGKVHRDKIRRKIERDEGGDVEVRGNGLQKANPIALKAVGGRRIGQIPASGHVMVLIRATTRDPKNRAPVVADNAAKAATEIDLDDLAPIEQDSAPIPAAPMPEIRVMNRRIWTRSTNTTPR